MLTLLATHIRTMKSWMMIIYLELVCTSSILCIYFCNCFAEPIHLTSIIFFPQYKSSSSIYCCYLLVLHDSFALVTFMNLMAYINFISFQSCVWVNFILCSRTWGVYCYRWKIYWVTILAWTCKLLTLPCVPMDNTLVWL
jgi:hypothetical protein